jgi:hypothetical protein
VRLPLTTEEAIANLSFDAIKLLLYLMEQLHQEKIFLGTTHRSTATELADANLAIYDQSLKHIKLTVTTVNYLSDHAAFACVQTLMQQKQQMLMPQQSL